MTAWLLTWVCQGAALVAVVAVALRAVPRLNAATRYAIWCGVLIAIACPPWISAAPAGEQPIYVPSVPDTSLSVLIGIWAAISFVNVVRLVSGLHAVYALRDRCRAFPRHLEARLPMWLETRDRGRRTELKICDAVPGATVLGFQRPCIALPSGLVDALAPAELDQIVLHEYAHVQRRDDWSRLAQALVLSALWIHPAAHLVSRSLNRQREMACDEWVVARTGFPKAYAKCLTHAAEVRGRMRGTPALLSAFLGTRHEIVQRVDRLLRMHRTPRRTMSLFWLAAAIAAMMIVSMQLQSVRFAELADAVLPQIGSAPVLWVRGVQEMQHVQDVQQVREVQQVQGVREVRGRITRHASQLAPVVTALAAPDGPRMSDLSARHFPAAYDAPIASIAPNAPAAPPALKSPIAPNRWSGVQIASAAKKTSIGVANVFSRAGVSLARSF